MRLVACPAARTPAPSPRRRGRVGVELAFVLPVFAMFIIGIVEYGRFLMMQQIVHNAARDAARWAVVRSSSPDGAVFTTDTGFRYPFEAPVSGSRPMYTVPFVKARLLTQTVGVEHSLSGMYVRVYVTDPALLYSDPAQILPKPGTTTWNQGGFSERLAVQVVGQFKPILPLPNFETIDVNIIVLMGIEG